MLLQGTAALLDAARRRRAVAGMVAYNLETAQAIIAAAEQTGLPVVLQAGSSAFAHAGRRPLAALALDLARASDAPVGVHLDHSRNLDEVTSCLAAGYSSVMIDGSSLPYAENVALTRTVVARAHDAGAWVEAELGAVAGHEDISVDATPETMTDPDQAADFVAATGVDALAVAVGNVHGFTSVPPHIDLDRLAALATATGIPLVLHGASGLPAEVLVACTERGVAKVNVNTELRRAFLVALSEALPTALDRVDLAGPLGLARDAVTEVAAAIMRTLARLEGVGTTTTTPSSEAKGR